MKRLKQKQLPNVDPKAKYWLWTIERDSEGGEVSLIMSVKVPLEKEKVWTTAVTRRRFVSGDDVVFLASDHRLSATDEGLKARLKAWKEGNWRKIDLRSKK